MNKLLIAAFLSLLFCSCNKKTEHEVLFQSVFNDIIEFSIKKNERDWDNIKAKVLDSIKEFQSIDDFYLGIEYTLNLIDDKHSFLIRANKNDYKKDTLKRLKKDVVDLPKIESKIVNKKIGYIKIKGFATIDGDIAKLYAIKIRKELIKLDQSSELSGWIIDLKNNFGGNSFVQPLGLSPIFKDSILGYHINNKENLEKVTCANNLYKKGEIRERKYRFW